MIQLRQLFKFYLKPDFFLGAAFDDETRDRYCINLLGPPQQVPQTGWL